MLLLAVSLLAIGGVNLLNMMLESVHERRQEIGIRLAVGARRRDVIGQFFLETFLVTLVGGIAGLVLGIGGPHASTPPTRCGWNRRWVTCFATRFAV
jgi:putative ABC transport system permease protein